MAVIIFDRRSVINNVCVESSFEVFISNALRTDNRLYTWLRLRIGGILGAFWTLITTDTDF